jgi:hypothetical protein
MPNMRGTMRLSFPIESKMHIFRTAVIQRIGVVLLLGGIVAGCTQAAPPPAVATPEPVQAAMPKDRTLHSAVDDMDARIITRHIQGDLSGLKVWRDSAIMSVSFELTNLATESLRMVAVEHWTDTSGKPIDRRMNDQEIVIAPSWTQTIRVSAPIPQARHLVLVLDSAH